jgi:large subunit ribosomal protein L25
MRAETILKATTRSESGKGAARKLRAAGSVPAVVYGGDEEALSLTIDSNEAYNLFQSISEENTIVTLDVKGVKGGIATLVREIQAHPFRSEILHIDFLRIQAGVAIEVEIPVHLSGTPVGVKNQGGILDQVLHTITVRSIPSKIPESIEVNIEELEVGQALHVGELGLEDEMEVITDLERMVVQVAYPRVEEEPEGELDEALEPELVGQESEEAPADEAAEQTEDEEGEE